MRQVKQKLEFGLRASRASAIAGQLVHADRLSAPTECAGSHHGLLEHIVWAACKGHWGRPLVH